MQNRIYLRGHEPVRTAIVHDWLVTYAGAERALEQILSLYPDADLYSLVDFIPQEQREFIHNKTVKTSFLQSFPFAKKKYRSYLPFMPLAIEQFDLSAYDLVISSSHAVAKGVLTHDRQLHICYCYTPMRYAWDLYQQYLRESGLDRGLKGMIARMVLHYVRMWDVASANRVDHYIAISHYIARRIQRVYGKEATVLYPPVDIDTFVPSTIREAYYLTASRMVPYKKVKLIVESFSRMPDKKLIVIGEGPDFAKIRSVAGRNIELLGYQPSSVLKEYMQKARAFVYAAEEDFGIVTVEAQACGTPVIAFGRGGSLETVIPSRRSEVMSQGSGEQATGLFFYEQTMDAIQEAVERFEKEQDSFDGRVLRKNAERFGEERFKHEFKEFVDRAMRLRFPLNTKQ
jgi:glycosyltransferase involved in cell wall biosynthesis